MKKLIAILMAACLLLASGCSPAAAEPSAPLQTADPAPTEPVSATSHEEVIYASLGADGSVSAVYAVTALETDAAGVVIEQGGFDSVKSLSEGCTATLGADGTVSIAAPAGRSYYQGYMTDRALPWRVAVGYKLDGRAVTAEELAGASGKLEISIETSDGSTGAEYRDNYLMQITVTLDASKCADISAEGATVASSGGDKTISFSVMPGKDGDFTVSADVTDFEMDGIQLAAVPMSMGNISIDTGSFGDSLTELTDGVSALADGASQIEGGAYDLSGGLSQLKSGSGGFYGGISELSGGSAALKEGSGKILAGLEQISAALAGVDFSQADQLLLMVQLMQQLSAGLGGVSGELGDLTSRFTASYGAIAAAVEALPEGGDFSALDGSEDETVQALLAAYREQSSAISALKSVFAAERNTFELLAATLPAIAGELKDASELAAAVASKIPTSINGQTIESFSQLGAALGELAKNYGEFNGKLGEYADGVSALASSYYSIDSGIASAASGAGSLASGATELAAGAAKLKDGVSGIDDKLEEAVDDMLDEYDRSDFTPTSFTSTENGKCAAVQFVFMTEPVKAEAAAPATPEVPSQTFWDRLKSLF